VGCVVAMRGRRLDSLIAAVQHKPRETKEPQ
jgi:hypothetical protein